MQAQVQQLWHAVRDDNLYTLTDFAGYKTEFLRLFGFAMAGVDYEADVNPEVAIPHLA